MSSRRVKQQLAALHQRQKTSSDLHHTLSASKKKRLRPREKRKKAQKDLKLVTDAKHTQQTVQKNLKYYQATTHSKATAQAAAVMSEVTHRVAPMVRFVLHSGPGVSIASFLCSCWAIQLRRELFRPDNRLDNRGLRPDGCRSLQDQIIRQVAWSWQHRPAQDRRTESCI